MTTPATNQASHKPTSPRGAYVTGTGTVTRSISFDVEVFKAMEKHRIAMRADRSSYLRAVLEDMLGIQEHPELRRTVPGREMAGNEVAPLSAAAIQKLIDRAIEAKLGAVIARDAATLRSRLTTSKTPKTTSTV